MSDASWDMIFAILFLCLGVGTYAAAIWWPVEYVFLVQCFALVSGFFVRAWCRGWRDLRDDYREEADDGR